MSTGPDERRGRRWLNLQTLKVRNLLWLLLGEEPTTATAWARGFSLSEYKMNNFAVLGSGGVRERLERLSCHTSQINTSVQLTPVDVKGVLSYHCFCRKPGCPHIGILALWGLRRILGSVDATDPRLAAPEREMWERFASLHYHLEVGYHHEDTGNCP